MPNQINQIGARVPLVDKDGNITREWFRFFELIGTRVSIIDGNITVTATAGTSGATPAQVAGYMVVNIAGKPQKIAYYNP